MHGLAPGNVGQAVVRLGNSLTIIDLRRCPSKAVQSPPPPLYRCKVYPRKNSPMAIIRNCNIRPVEIVWFSWATIAIGGITKPASCSSRDKVCMPSNLPARCFLDKCGVVVDTGSG